MRKKTTYEDLEQRIGDLEKGKDASKGNDSTPKNSEAFYRLMLESISDTVIITDDQGNMVYVCPNTTKIFGFSHDEVLSLNTIQKLMDGSICDISDLKKQGEFQNLEWTLKDANGQTRFLIIDVKRVNINGGTVLYVMRDITDRKQDEEYLKRYRSIISSTPDGISLLDKNYRYVIVNDAYEKFSGMDRENIIGLTISEYFGKEVFEKYIQPNFDKCLQGEIVNYQEWFEFPALGKRFIDITYYPYRGEGNKITGVVANGRDITSQRLAEAALRKSREKYQELAESISDVFFAMDKDLRYTYWNKASEILTGIPAEKAMGKTLMEVFPDNEARKQVKKIYLRVIETKKPEQLITRYPGNDQIIHEINTYPTAEGVAVFIKDITERKRLEGELLRAQKLESVGLLAGGIAHDFNNILTIILGNIFMAKMQVVSGDELFELLSEAEMASYRAQALTRQLLTFAKGGVPVKETASIKDLLKESCSFVLRGSKSTCKFSIAEDLRPAELDSGQMSQVINNIVINANQAMPEGGTIRVAADNLILEDRHNLPVKPGRYIKISIMDHGVGIAEKHLSMVFDPYFTTKQEGSGLGLAMCYSIIKNHEGHITVESRLGVGTTFHIYLPASEKAVSEKEEVKLIKGQGRILVMDDEASLRKMVGRMLEKLGYECEFAKNGAEAIEMYKRAKEAEKPYAAVILDLTIPGGMGGTEAIKKLLEVDPEIKAIVSSGYSDDPVLANFQEYGFKSMIPKPFESRALGKVLHEVLTGGKNK
jgi:two-component system, cell cycle sensor histidine kinase and response regulator CckA